GRRDGDRQPDGRLPVPAPGPHADAVPGALAGGTVAGRWHRRAAALRCLARAVFRLRGARVLTHCAVSPEPFSAFVALQAPKGGVILGIDEDTAAVGCNNAWQVHGRGGVTVWRGRHRERFRRGEAFRIDGAVDDGE